MMKIVRALLAFLAVVIVPACGGGGGGDSTTIIQEADRPVSGWIVMLSDTNALLFIDPATPSVLKRIVPVLGLPAGVTLNAIAFRPATGNLYARSTTNGTFEVDPVTGGTVFPGLTSINFGGSPFEFSISINPVSDSLRVINNELHNGRLLIPTGSGYAIDTDLSAGVRQIAYTNNFAGAAVTTLFGINDTNLVRIGGPDGTPSPNTGIVTVIGPHGAITGGITGGNGAMGFAIAASGTAYMAYNGPTLATDLWRVDLTTGAGTLLGSTGMGYIRGIAVVP